MKKELKTAYFDCSSGISGDMCLGAIIDAGLPLEKIEGALKKLNINGYRLAERKVNRAGISATKVDVVVSSSARSREAKGRTWKDIRSLIQKARFPDDTRKKAFSIFQMLFDAEAKVHGQRRGSVHLHELSGTDCIVDIVGTIEGLRLLDIGRVYASPVNTGTGTVITEHGELPVPAPATAELLKNIPVYSSGAPFELTTPTGAAIVKALSSGFGEIPVFIPERIGCGAGSLDMKEKPNILRIFIGDSYSGMAGDAVTVIETNIDDMNPQLYDYVFDKLFAHGALDVCLTAIMMKKNRPGIKVSILCSAERRNDLIGILLKETTTIGVRYYETERVTMEREVRRVKTKFGDVRLKISRSGPSITKYAPEFDDCRRIAERENIPLIDILEEAKRHAGGKK